jgi:hypothetical protein
MGLSKQNTHAGINRHMRPGLGVDLAVAGGMEMKQAAAKIQDLAATLPTSAE